MTALEARDLAIGYGATEIARGLDLSVIAGSVTCLLGPNGVGKTTLFKTLLGLIPPLSGAVAINGSDLSRLDRQAIARQIAYVPQAQIAEFPYTVIDLVVMGLYTALAVRLLAWMHTPRKQTVVNRVFSGLFAAAAVVLSLVRRGPATA